MAFYEPYSDLIPFLNYNTPSLSTIQSSSDDIKNAYRRMCVTFHPDKHHRAEDKEAAERQFQMIQKAYDVLSNPGRRHMYDSYGMEGLSRNWEVGPRLRTPEEVREEYERQNRQRLQNEVDNLVRSKGEILVGLNATTLFQPLRSTQRKAKLPVGMPGIGLSSSIPGRFVVLPLLIAIPIPLIAVFSFNYQKAKIGPQTDFAVQGNVLARNGVGAGTVVGTLRHVISPMLWGELSGSLGQNQMASIKLVKNFTTDIFATFHAVSTSPAVPPPITLSVGRKLTDNTTGYMTYRTGSYALGYWGDGRTDPGDMSSCAVGFVRKDNVSQWTLDMTAGLAASFVSLSYFRFFAKGTRGRISFVAGTSTGLQGSLTVDKKINKHDRVALGVECGNLTGILMRLRYMRLGQKLSVPVIISPDLDLQLAFLAAVVPFIAVVSFDRLVFEPWRQKKFEERLKIIRLENAEVLAERKRNAEDAIKLMRDQVGRKVDAEEMKNGLIVVEALYGKLPPSPNDRFFGKELSFGTIRGMFSNVSGSSTPMESRADLHEGISQDAGVEPAAREYIEVTLPVQNLVVNSQLHINGGFSKSHLMGFYDPCLGESKTLRITYSFRGKLHFLEVDDTSAVAAPLRAHLTGEDRKK
ncbi:hypothetical protein HDU97_001065 [Phlyctochytrium planicorne]|nr:hypothetical protein HDU97_001065 [Phlyctochytrium planicorne]